MGSSGFDRVEYFRDCTLFFSLSLLKKADSQRNLAGYPPVMHVISSILFFFAENFSHVNLIIEQGNTSSKVAVYNGWHMEASFVYKKFDVDELESLFGKYDFKHGILSTVIGKNEELNDYLRGKLQRFIFLDRPVGCGCRG